MNVSSKEFSLSIKITNHNKGDTISNEMCSSFDILNLQSDTTPKELFSQILLNKNLFVIQCQTVSKIIKTDLNDRIKYINKHFNLFDFIYRQFEEIVEEVSVAYPTEELSQSFKLQLMSVLSSLRFSSYPDPDVKTDKVIQCAQEFFDRTQKALKSSPKLDKKQSDYSDKLVGLIKEILKNPLILDMPISCFTEEKLPNLWDAHFTVDTSVILLKNHMQESINKIRVHFLSIVPVIEQKLKQYSDLRSHDLLNPSEKLRKMVVAFREEKLPELNRLNVEDFRQVYGIRKKLKELLQDFRDLFARGDNFPNEFFLSDHTTVNLMLDSLIKHIRSMNPKVSDDDLFCLDDYNRIPMSKLAAIEFMPKIIKGKWTFKEIKQIHELYRDIFYWHRLGSSFISNPIQQILDTELPNLSQWYSSHSKKKNFDDLLTVISPPKRSRQPERSIDSLVEFIEGPKKGNKNKPKPKRKTETSSDNDVLAEKPQTVTKPQETKQISRPIVDNSESLNYIEAFSTESKEALSYLLEALKILERAKSPKAFAALRESVMHLMDVLLIDQQVEQKTPFAVVQEIYGIYHVCEQYLRYSNLIQFGENQEVNHHNLVRLYKQLHPKEDEIDIPECFRDFQFANYWVNYTVAMRRSWVLIQNEDRPIPPILNHIHQLMEPQKSKEVIKVQAALQEHAKKAISFVKELFKAKISTTVLQWKSIALTPPKKIDISGMNELLIEIENLTSELPWAQSHTIYDKFKQVQSDLKYLIEGITTLNQPIQSMNLSLLVRGIFFKQARIIEQILQIIYEIKKGEDISDHDMSLIRTKISKYDKVSQKSMEFLEVEYAKAHKTTRNPFQEQEPVNRLHEWILIAEMIRENPEYAIGFEKQNDDNKTWLNFLPIASKKKAMHYEIIHSEIATLLQKTVSIVRKELIEELKYLVSTQILK